MNLLLPAALFAASLALAFPARAASDPAAAAVTPRKVDPAALELVRLAPLPRAKSTAGNPLRPQLQAPQPVTRTLETRVRFDAGGAPQLDCVEADGHAHPHGARPAAEASR